MKSQRPRPFRTHYRKIEAEFVGKILSGEKQTLIYPLAFDVEASDWIEFLGAAEGKAPQYVLTVYVTKAPTPIVLESDGATLYEEWVTDAAQLNKLARLDGFTSYAQMCAWYEKRYPRKRYNAAWRFEGRLIFFDNPKVL